MLQEKEGDLEAEDLLEEVGLASKGELVGGEGEGEEVAVEGVIGGGVG